MKNKVILITGATSGIGKVTATELAKMQAHVVIIARNKDKAFKTRDEIIAESGNENIDVFIGDLSSIEEVKRVAGLINAAYTKIDVLINNAGLILGTKREESVDGNELTLATNHLGPFLLTALLFNLLKESDGARIINVSSDAYGIARVDFKNIQLKKGYSSIKAYANSKLYNLLFTKELDRRIKKNQLNITTNTLHPGVIKTGFGQKSNGFAGFIFKTFSFMFTSPEKGAQTTIYLATSAEGGQISGEYFTNKKINKTNQKKVNESNAKELWGITESLTGIKFL